MINISNALKYIIEVILKIYIYLTSQNTIKSLLARFKANN